MHSPERAAFSDLWAKSVAQHPDRTFLLFEAGQPGEQAWTYREFDELVTKVARNLRQAGVVPGSPVHMVLRNCPAFIALWIAVGQLRAWMIPVDPASAARDIARQVERVQPVVSVIARSRAEVFEEGAAGRVPHVIAIEEDAADLADGAQLVADAPAHQPLTPEPEDRLAVMFTSGTTSEPKGVVLTQNCYAVVAKTMSQIVDLQPSDRWFVTLPLFHANAQYYCFAPAIAVGASVAMMATFSASRWVDQARQAEVTHASLFAAPIRMILARTPDDTAPIRLAHVWYAQNLGEEHHRAFAQLVGTAPRQLYGMTETIPVVTADVSEPAVHDLIGPAIEGRTIRLVDENGSLVTAEGQPGEIQVFGHRGRDLFEGYLDAPEINARVFIPEQDGTWFRTGDLATVDQNGALRFVGRVDDVVKVSGENVSLTEIEAVAAQAPGILEVAVVARPDAVRDHVPVAYFVPRDSAQAPTPETLTAWARENLSPAARPVEWIEIDALPRTSTGKLRRFKMN